MQALIDALAEAHAAGLRLLPMAVSADETAYARPAHALIRLLRWRVRSCHLSSVLPLRASPSLRARVHSTCTQRARARAGCECGDSGAPRSGCRSATNAAHSGAVGKRPALMRP